MRQAGEFQFILLHGLGATGGVWRPLQSLLARIYGDAGLPLDMPGHGSGAVLDRYEIDDVADAVAGSCLGSISPNTPLIIIGHSYGGVVALALASGDFGLEPERVFSLGIKVTWSNDEVAVMNQLAVRAPKKFETRREALAFYARVAGIAPQYLDEIGTETAVCATGSGWRLSQAPKTNAVSAPAMAALSDAALCPFHLARGENDPMVALAELRAFDKNACNISGGGHNAMIDAPMAVMDWLNLHLSETEQR